MSTKPTGKPTVKPIFCLTLGLPGSGKTYSLEKRFGLEELLLLDLDKEMVRHPQYDPTDAAKVYEDPDAYQWANDQVQARLDEICAMRPLPPLVALDGTGTHVDRQVARITQARQAGFHIVLLHVRISLAKALERNRRRARQVPEEAMKRYVTALGEAVVSGRGGEDTPYPPPTTHRFGATPISLYLGGRAN